MRKVRHYLATEKPAIIQPGTKEWYHAEEKRMEEMLLDSHMRAQQQDGGEWL
jgi:hypothetical protein